MKTFHALFSVEIVHEYYRSHCPDFDFVPTPACRKTLQMGRMVAKHGEGRIDIFYEGGPQRSASIPMEGEGLVFYLRLKNGSFGNFTDLAQQPGIPVYRNGVGSDLVSDRAGLVGGLFRHSVQRAELPLQLVVLDRLGREAAREAIHEKCSEGHPFDLAGFPAGSYSVEERGAQGTTSTPYYLEPEMSLHGIFAVVEIEVTKAQYQIQAEYRIRFQAKEETLRYYVVAKKFTATELGTIAVTDAATTGTIHFAKGTAGSAVANLQQMEPDAKILVFSSQQPVKRNEKGREKIQLTKNGEVLIKHLPQPGPERTTGDIIIHISKR